MFFWKNEGGVLGHIISSQGIQVDPKKIEAMQEWPRPNNVTELRGSRG
jgi:hypothetical protein